MDAIERVEELLMEIRRENGSEHKEILSKLNVIDNRCTALETDQRNIKYWQKEHNEDHKDVERTSRSHMVAILLLAIALVGEGLLAFMLR